ncbi:MAG: enoyl-CoA hydratase/isomerase family protein [Acidimicrobiia bacterium]
MTLTGTAKAAVDRYEIDNAERRSDAFVVGRKGHTGIVLLDRPEAGNSHTRAMILGLSELWIEWDDDPSIRTMVMGSTTDKFFCTGIDLKEASQLGFGSPQARGSGRTHRDVPVLKPMITAVEGMAVGGGLHWVVESDIVIAGDKATFRDTHVEVGIVGGRENLGFALKAGLGAALYISLIGKKAVIDANRAERLGVVQEVVPAGTALERALELADGINDNSPAAMAKELEVLWAMAEMHYNDAVRYGWERVYSQQAHPDAKEGPRSFAEKRKPNWTV